MELFARELLNLRRKSCCTIALSSLEGYLEHQEFNQSSIGAFFFIERCMKVVDPGSVGAS
jgi:hypothetical protein